MNINRLKWLLVTLFTVVLLVPDVLWAEGWYINESQPMTITISGNFWDYGPTVSGDIISFESFNSPYQAVQVGNTVYFPSFSSGYVNLSKLAPVEFWGWEGGFAGTWPEPGGTYFSRTIYLVEAANPNIISDILSYSTEAYQVTDLYMIRSHGTFTSDMSGPLGLLPSDVNPNNVFIENGQRVFLTTPSLLAGIGYIDLITSSPSAVPEPSTMLLLGSGLIGLVGYGRKKLFKK